MRRLCFVRAAMGRSPQGSDAEAMQSEQLAPEEPARRTVEVEAFCSWSAWRNEDAVHGLGQHGLIGLVSQGC